jgi:hypothetical protein
MSPILMVGYVAPVKRYRCGATVPTVCPGGHECDSNGIDESQLTSLCHIYIIVVCPDVNLWLR